MMPLVSIGLYASILWVLGVVVIRERRRARSMGRIQMALPHSMSPYDRR
jgi:hypothetical protein